MHSKFRTSPRLKAVSGKRSRRSNPVIASVSHFDTSRGFVNCHPHTSHLKETVSVCTNKRKEISILTRFKKLGSSRRKRIR